MFKVVAEEQKYLCGENKSLVFQRCRLKMEERRGKDFLIYEKQVIKKII